MWSWTWHAHPEVWALAIVLYGGYRLLLKHAGPRVVGPREEVASRGKRRAFAAAVIVLVLASEWPMHDLAERYLYSVHMIQHLLLTLVMSALFLAGTPAWMFRMLLPGRAMRAVRFLSKPMIALVIFNVAIVTSHWPVMVELSVRYEAAHFAQHLVIVASALLMWMPVLSPVIEVPRLSYPGQMMYLFLQSLVPTVPASFLTFGDRPLYAIYETFPRIADISALADMRTAGLIMKIAAGLVLWGYITVIFFRWATMERSHGVDALALRDLDRSLNQMELTER